MNRTRCLLLALLLLSLLAACVSEPDEPDSVTVDEATAPPASPAAAPEVRASVPFERYSAVDVERLERERNEDSWRQAAEMERNRLRRDAADARSNAATADPASDRSSGSVLDRLRSGATGSRPTQSSAAAEGASSQQAPESESWEDLAKADVFDRPPLLPVPQAGGGPTVLRVQQMLDRIGFSPGVIDGRWGKNTEKAIYWLQDALGEEPTGEVDAGLFDRLSAEVGGSAVRSYRVTSADLEGPFETIPEEPTAMAELDCLCYESAQEGLAERFHTTVELLEQLNPDADLQSLQAGDELRVPNVETPAEGREPNPEIARLVISSSGKYLHVLDGSGNLLRHFPTTVGSGYDPSPEGELTVSSVALEPDFHYQPKLFHDVPDEEADALLPAGPNSPVGEVWIQLSRDNYGIHGTAEPATIGYTTSHGCIRLTNWDAIPLANQVPQGVTVEFLESGETSAAAEQ